MDPTAGPAPTPSTPPPAEPRQRWRVAYARRAPATAETVGREYAALWEAALEDSELPLVRADSGRPRLALGAPLPVGITARRELLDFWLSERRPAWQVREALESRLPADHAIVGLESVWLGAPALPGRVAGADYLVTLAGPVDPSALAAAAARLLAAPRLLRERAKGGGVKAYDLRPLLGDVEVADAGPTTVVRLRTLNNPELGSGRPDEVIAALGEELGAPLEVSGIVREELVLADDLA